MNAGGRAAWRRSGAQYLLGLGLWLGLGLGLALTPAASARGERESLPARATARPAGQFGPAISEFVVDAAAPGPVMHVALIGNASRLDTLLALRSASDLRAGRGVPGADYFRQRFPHFEQFRIGNTLPGYACAGLDFDELVVRGADGRFEYRFEQTLLMLQRLVDAGIRPHLALTGTPLALVPAGEEPIRHEVYGCLNAPRIDWSRAEARDRVPDWWALQDAFLGALIERFGRSEIARWTFATWTEPFNPARKPAHLVLPADVVGSGRHDAGVAAIVAASIDAAMKHGVRIRLGNMAGPVERDYPALIREIGRFPRGKEYLAYIEGYAVSRYRTQPGRPIDRSLEAAFSLLRDPAMPDKPLYIDELGDLSGLDGAVPFAPAAGLAEGIFLSVALQRVFERQDGTARSPAGVALWRHQIGPRGRDLFARPQAYLATPGSHVVGMFAALNGAARLPLAGPPGLALAAMRQGQISVILLAPGGERALFSPATRHERRVVVTGLAPSTAYRVRIVEIGRVHGNPISRFLDGAPGYAQDSQGRFVRSAGRWVLSSPRWEACFHDEDASCAWRTAARTIEEPSVRTLQASSGRSGILTVAVEGDSAAIATVQVQRAD